MILNYIKVSLRNIRRHTSYTALNVLGLSLGIACAVLIFSFVKYHVSFDDFHADSDRIYRIVTEQHRDQVSYVPSVPNPLGKVLREDHTFAEKIARVATFDSPLITIEESGNSRKFKEAEMAFVEPEFFDIFNYPLAQGGSHAAALHAPHSALITERIAKKYFGDESAMGKSLMLDTKIQFTVTGILKDLPPTSDRVTEIYFPYPDIKEYNDWFVSDASWGGITSNMQCFIKLKPGITVAEVEQVFPAYVTKYRPNNKNVHHYKLQPLRDMHFNAQYRGVMSIRNLWVLSLIGLFLIITACVNFINLATAQALNRSKEVGVRKSLGGRRFQFFWQFITETGVITVMATVLSLAIAYSCLPYLNEWFKAQISINLFTDWQLLLFIPALIILVTFISGSYPGLILSGFQPVLALKGKMSQQKIGGFNTRRTLIIAQFTISQVLLIGLIVVIYQLKYAQQADMGFKKDAILVMPLVSEGQSVKTLRDQFAQLAGVEQATLCYVPPASRSNWGSSLVFDNRTEEEAFSISFRGGDEHFLSTFDLSLVAGRNLIPSDSVREFLVNETFAKKLNFTNPEDILGKTMTAGRDWSGPIVGVIRDFHDQSFHEEVKPVFVAIGNFQTMAVRIKATDMNATMASIEKTWTTMYLDKIYEYEFLDDQIAQFYETEDTMMKLIQVFSFIAIFIGCMGLYGLVSFMAVQKTKEIGIRKVLGGSLSHILWIFGKEFALLIIGAFVLAAPIGWWLMNSWLEDFEYKITLSPWIFVAAIGITSLIAFLTVSYQSIRAALMNPARSLKTE